MDTKRIILALGLAVVGFVVFTQVKKLGTPAPIQQVLPQPKVETVEYSDVLVAALDIPFGTRMIPESLQWAQWPTKNVTEAFITSDVRPDAIEELSRAISRTAIYSGEPIIERKLIRAGAEGVMAALLKPGMRAVTTRIAVETAAGGFIQPGDRVDIILTIELPRDTTLNTNASNTRQFAAQTIFENVHVLAVDQTYSATEDGGAAIVGSTATFEMTQGDAELLQQAESSGDLSLTLRGINDARARPGRSAATVKRNSSGQSTTITVYRDGTPQYVAVRGN